MVVSGDISRIVSRRGKVKGLRTPVSIELLLLMIESCML